MGLSYDLECGLRLCVYGLDLGCAFYGVGLGCGLMLRVYGVSLRFVLGCGLRL